MLNGRRRQLALVVVAAGLVACGSEVDAGGAVGSVALSGQPVELAVRDGSICARRAGGGAVHCVTAIGRVGEDVLAAVYEDDGPTGDLALVVTAPDVSLGGLGPGAARAEVALGSGRRVVLWLARQPPGGRRLCLTSGRPGLPAMPVTVDRTATVVSDAAATFTADGCV